MISVELVLLVISVLFGLSILAMKAGYRFGVPVLLLFLAVGMLGGSDGLGIQFENLYVAQIVGTIALCIILFSGGMDTKFTEIRPVLAQGIILATFGVLITAVLTGLAIWWIFGMTDDAAGPGLLTALLIAATMSSTDSASVFSILRSRGLHLKHNLRPLLELESGSNDPMAYVLVIAMIDVIQMAAAPAYLEAAGTLALQLAIGAVTGYVLGRLSVYLINNLKIENDALYPVMVFTFCIFIFSVTYFLKGNSYLAVYISGLVIGNSRFVHKRSSMRFFEGLAWLSQLLMFLALGLLVNPHELLFVIVPGLITSFVLILVTRPLSVFISLSPFPSMRFREKVFVSWVGLRGAVPIVFAIIPLAADVPHARTIFNIVFFCTLVSLVVQGTTLPRVAAWLGLSEKPKKLRKMEEFDLEFSDEIKSVTTEISLTAQALRNGTRLMDMPLPENTLAVLVKRNNVYFVPTGKTELLERDKLLLITDDQEALLQTMKNLGLHS